MSTEAMWPHAEARVDRGSRLDDLLATYAELKPKADELATRLKTVTDAIKVELTGQLPGVQRIDVSHESLEQPLRLTYVERYTLDTRRLKAEHPETYVRFARKDVRWELRGIKA